MDLAPHLYPLAWRKNLLVKDEHSCKQLSFCRCFFFRYCYWNLAPTIFQLNGWSLYLRTIFVHLMRCAACMDQAVSIHTILSAPTLIKYTNPMTLCASTFSLYPNPYPFIEIQVFNGSKRYIRRALESIPPLPPFRALFLAPRPFAATALAWGWSSMQSQIEDIHFDLLKPQPPRIPIGLDSTIQKAKHK